MILKANEEMAHSALRVLGFAFRNLSDWLECSEESSKKRWFFSDSPA